MTILDRFSTNPTQLVGLLSFAAATIACLTASWRSDRRDSRTWWIMVFTSGFFFVEVLIGLRHRIHDYLAAILMAEGQYGQRRGMQESMIVGLTAAALILVILFFLSRRPRGGSVRVAAGLTAALLLLFAIETVSLHALDAVYYRPIGPVMLIGWLWAIGAAGICWAALTVRRFRPKITRPGRS